MRNEAKHPNEYLCEAEASALMESHPGSPDPDPDDSPFGNRENLNSRHSEIKRRLIRLDEIEPVLSANYLVKGWLLASGLSVLFGPSNAGKTFVALDIAMHVAAGEDWRDCKVNAGPVLYIAAEGGAGILNRLAAFKAENPHMASAPFTLLPIGVDLHASGDAEIIVSLLADKKPALIVVDTLARSIGEGDENTAKDTAMFVRNCDLMREMTGAHVMIIHHTGKEEDRGARGSSALRAAVDTEILVGSNHRISSKKQRDMIAPADLYFALRSVALGYDEDGDPVTSAVVEQSDKPIASRKPLKGKDEVAMTALTEALAEHGLTDMGNDYPSGVTVVSMKAWREKCAEHELTTGSSDSAARTAFKRAKDRLIELNLVRGFNNHFWKVRDDA